jgi:hypothetical protein
MDSSSALLFSFKDAASKEQQWQEKTEKERSRALIKTINTELQYNILKSMIKTINTGHSVITEFPQSQKSKQSLILFPNSFSVYQL